MHKILIEMLRRLVMKIYSAVGSIVCAVVINMMGIRNMLVGNGWKGLFEISIAIALVIYAVGALVKKRRQDKADEEFMRNNKEL